MKSETNVKRIGKGRAIEKEDHGKRIASYGHVKRSDEGHVLIRMLDVPVSRFECVSDLSV